MQDNYEKLKKCVEFYANKETQGTAGLEINPDLNWRTRFGEMARQTLKEIEQMKPEHTYETSSITYNPNTVEGICKLLKHIEKTQEPLSKEDRKDITKLIKKLAGKK